MLSFYNDSYARFCEGYIIVWLLLTKKQMLLLIFSDYNECGLNNAGCEQICKNSVGSYNCDCRKGFKLRANLYGCEGLYFNRIFET